MYENLKTRIEDRCIMSSQAAKDFGEGATNDFTIQEDHPAVIQVISETKDVRGCAMPNLIYVSRQKSLTSPHHFKAGALNVLVRNSELYTLNKTISYFFYILVSSIFVIFIYLYICVCARAYACFYVKQLRVSSIMTNAPIVLTLDCDMISNDPSTPQQMLCFFMDSSVKSNLGYVQFPVRFNGVNKADIYGSEFKRMYHINPMGLNGLSGPDYFGTGTFFNRQVFFGGPSSSKNTELEYVVKKPINNHAILESAHNMASCDYENQSDWGLKKGFRYGSLVEDYFTGYQLHCQGWKSIFCNPKRASFLSEMPISLHEMITQTKRWSVGLLEVSFSKYSPLTFGTKSLGPLMAHCYSYYAFGPSWSIPILFYAFLPQIYMLHNISIFPKVSDPWFLLYMFLFVGAYGQDLLEFILEQGTTLRWWSDQRMWLVRGLSSDFFGTLEYVSNRLGIASRGFNVTTKVNDNEQRTQYDNGKFQFGVVSPVFMPFSTAAIVNLIAVFGGFLQLLRGTILLDEFLGQIIISSFGMVNSWPVYEAMFFRTDKGRMPTKITIFSVILAWLLISLMTKM
ncbi:PREDICTED: cellulose synthase-like protein G3 isoform X1 [Erythranthe guttata]|uniref:cellulose synthase-like protein G3 isoform X1 n=1 Tax=Erythranthe guttata TaxID=4155 RepID=UPI00064DB2D3|nr:PREDICTED: cellulose synthase-like protein G3 isoform X1 [Erythranthe guttata]|eukprot:XP_012829785.1 PREDICTED: cellulose synthase-like protein G3 isoform X1 [Erythranthe guttata]